MDHGIPVKVSSNSLWFNVRQRLLTRKRKRGDDLLRYGGSETCNAYGNSEGWNTLLNHMSDKKIGRWNDARTKLSIKKTRAGVDYLKEVRAHRDVQELYAKLD